MKLRLLRNEIVAKFTFNTGGNNMSHFTSISTEIRDIEICKKALNNMGLELQAIGDCRFYFGSEIKENVVKLPGPYDMALESNGNGGYQITADFYRGYVERTIGYGGEVLLQNYATEMLRSVAKKMHMSVSQHENGLKVRDPQDPNGGFMIVQFGKDGSVSFEPRGIKGKNCSKFLKLEDALGKVVRREFTKEYYQATTETVNTGRERLKVGY